MSSLARLPEAFVHRLKKIVPPDQWAETEAGFLRPTPTCFRVNTLKAKPDEVIAALNHDGVTPESVHWSKHGYVVPDEQRERLTHSSVFSEGLLYIQNLSSMYTAQVLSAKPGEEILDLAAAPGGKTLAVACDMENQGRIAAVEPVKSRFFRLKNNVELYGAGIVQCYLKDGSLVGRQVPERFDRVLLDAPCSSESRFYVNDPATFQYWSEKKVKEMQRKQKQLLHSALQALKPGGVMVYSTCSYAPEENELVLDRQLKRYGEQLEVLPVTVPFSNYQAGLTEWGRKTLDARLKHAVRILPSDTMEGFFLSVLKKQVEKPS